MEIQEIIKKELHSLDIEIRFEKNETRKIKLRAAKAALEWVLNPTLIPPSDYMTKND